MIEGYGACTERPRPDPKGPLVNTSDLMGGYSAYTTVGAAVEEAAARTAVDQDASEPLTLVLTLLTRTVV